MKTRPFGTAGRKSRSRAIKPPKEALQKLSAKVVAQFDEKLSLNQRKFLACYVKAGSVGPAAILAGMNRNTHFAWKRNDPAYAAAFEVAHDMMVEMLEGLVHQRADLETTCAIFRLKALKPEMYRDPPRTIVNNTGVPVPTPQEGINLDDLPLPLREQLVEWIRKREAPKEN